MKRVHSFLIGLVFSLILFSCEKETILTVDQTSLSFTDAGGSSSITLSANKPWSATSNQSWCKVSPSAGEEATGSRLSITCDANTTYDARNATVTITCAELTKQISITQATNNGLLVSQTSYELTKAAQQLNIQVQANVKFSVEVDNSCKDWIKYNSIKGLSTSTVVLDIAENKTYDSREGKVTIKQDGGNLSSTVTIKQSQLDGLFITTPEYNLSNEKHTLTVVVSTNVEFDVKPEADWVKYVQTKGLNTKQIVLQVEENDTYDQRETKVNVKQKSGDLSGVITIKQDEKYGILVTQHEYNLSNEAATIDVEVKYNVDFDVVIPDEWKEWIRQISTKNLDSKIYTFSIAKNESYDNREGSITFKQKKGAISTTVIIKQDSKDGLIAEKTEYDITADEQQLDIKIRSNITYEVLIDEACKDWIRLIQTKGLVENRVSLFISKNEGGSRSGKIVLKGDKIQEIITIYQEKEGLIEFEDANFKAYCVSNFDKDGDGEISRSEALAVTDIYVITDNISSLKGIEHFSNLSILDCFGNEKWDYGQSRSVGMGKLKKLDISKNTLLTVLECANNQLTELDVSQNKGLIRLGCYSNMLTALDVSNNKSLTELRCDNNQLTSLDVSKNSALNDLSCSSNQLKFLIIDNNPALSRLNCYSNQLTSLNVSNSTALFEINCYSNQLLSLDVGNNTALTQLICSSNQLAELDVSNNTALSDLNCSSNRLTSLNLLNNRALQMLSCESNRLTSLNVSNCSGLRSLYCSSNQLTSLDISGCTALTELSCYINQLTSLDFTNCRGLTTLRCFSNKLLSLDVTKCPALTIFECYSNLLVSLDLSKCPALSSLNCNTNQLNYLDVSKCTVLTYLNCSINQLSSIDVSNCSVLSSLDCYSNRLTSLDVTKCTSLTSLQCFENPLNFIFMATGQSIPTLSKPESTVIEYPGNVYFADAGFKAYCVSNFDKDGDREVSKEEARAVKTINIDTKTITSLKGIEYFINLQSLTCKPTWQTSSDSSTGWDLYENGKEVIGLLTTLDLSNNPLLHHLNCGGNQLNSINISTCFALTDIDCSYNYLSSLDVTNCPTLTNLFCSSNRLSSLDVSNNTLLTSLECQFNQLNTLDVSLCNGLTRLNCNNNPLTTIYLLKNHAISSLIIPADTEVIYREGRSGGNEGIGYDVWE